MRRAPPLAAAVLVVAAWAAPAARAAVDGVRVATLTTAQGDAEAREPALLPRGLGAADLARYRQIFASLGRADWPEAARVTGEVEDEVLLGHVLAERYLSPRSSRTGFVELAAWLERFADLPQAGRIHRLAMARRPAGAPAPREPEPAGDTSAAAWPGGLAAWRRGDAAGAADRFTRLAHDPGGEETARARAAFWAARANLRARRPQLVVPMLQLAAQGSDGFYGPLAQRMLDDGIAFDRAERRAAGGVVELLVRYPAARRILALGAVGERELADAELRHLATRAPSDLVHDLAAVARTLALPSAGSGAAAQPTGRTRAGGKPPPLPPPGWRPADGYRLDPSLLHAVIRAESGFDPAARSPRGALGLMQVMPETARHLARLTQVAYAGDAWLLEPSNNMAIGQAWLRQLAGTPTVGSSLIHLLAAYNAGEGRLQAWLAGELAATADDPLLFVESVPLAETRGYVKKVLANLWVYQARAGSEVPSLRALAENRWPELEPPPNPVPRPKFKARGNPRQVHARAD